MREPMQGSVSRQGRPSTTPREKARLVLTKAEAAGHVLTLAFVIFVLSEVLQEEQANTQYYFIGNAGFLGCFLLEQLVKACGFWSEWSSDVRNVLDALLVLLGVGSLGAVFHFDGRSLPPATSHAGLLVCWRLVRAVSVLVVLRRCHSVYWWKLPCAKKKKKQRGRKRTATATFALGQDSGWGAAGGVGELGAELAAQEDEDDEPISNLDRATELLRHVHSLAVSIADKEEIQWLLGTIAHKDEMYMVDVDVTGADEQTIDYLAEVTGASGDGGDDHAGYRMSHKGGALDMSARASFRHAGMRLSTIAALNQALHEGEAHAQLGPPLTVEALVGELGADVLGQLALIGDQRFDILSLSKALGPRLLPIIGMKLLQEHHFINDLGLHVTKLHHFLQDVTARYRDNPYHNAVHAADVAQSVHFMYISSKRTRDYLSEFDLFALILGAIIHDVDHRGLTNKFCVDTAHDLALLYNDKSVMENHHASVGFSILKTAKNNFAEALSAEQFRELRVKTIQAVTHTDMSLHFPSVGSFQAMTKETKLSAVPSAEQKTMVLNLLLHTADLSNPTRPMPIYMQWAERVQEEFFKQGDEEKQHGLPVSNFFDRDAPNVPKCQLGFLNFIVKPLFQAWTQFDAEFEPYVNMVDAHTAHWTAEMDKAISIIP